jgi:hypothetical protein
LTAELGTVLRLLTQHGERAEVVVANLRQTSEGIEAGCAFNGAPARVRRGTPTATSCDKSVS